MATAVALSWGFLLFRDHLAGETGVLFRGGASGEEVGEDGSGPGLQGAVASIWHLLC